MYTVILEDIYRLRHSLRDVPAPVTVGRLPPTSHGIAEKNDRVAGHPKIFLSLAT